MADSLRGFAAQGINLNRLNFDFKCVLALKGLCRERATAAAAREVALIAKSARGAAKGL